jgi:hypothetical protein
MDKHIIVSPDSPLFSVIQKVIRDHFKEYNPERSEKTVKINGAGTFKIVVEWFDENTSTYEIFKVIEEKSDES